jgi:hypothetical protein
VALQQVSVGGEHGPRLRRPSEIHQGVGLVLPAKQAENRLGVEVEQVRDAPEQLQGQRRLARVVRDGPALEQHLGRPDRVAARLVDPAGIGQQRLGVRPLAQIDPQRRLQAQQLGAVLETAWARRARRGREVAEDAIGRG